MLGIVGEKGDFYIVSQIYLYQYPLISIQKCTDMRISLPNSLIYLERQNCPCFFIGTPIMDETIQLQKLR